MNSITPNIRKVDFELIPELIRLKHLKEGWSVMNEGRVIASKELEAAQELYFELLILGFGNFEFQPGLDGEVLIRAKFANYIVDLIVTRDSGLEYYLLKDGEEVAELIGINKVELFREIRKITNSCRRTLECSTRSGFTTTGHTAEWLSDLGATQQYLYLAKSALLSTVGRYAPT